MFSLAFVITPYWSLIGKKTGSITAEIAGLIFTIGLGIAWSYISGGDIRAKISLKSLILLVIMVGGLAVINFNALNYNIPWRGDEDFHIKKTLDLLKIISLKWVLLYLIFQILLFYKIFQKPWRLLRITVVLISGIIPFLFIGYIFIKNGSSFLLRYPFVDYWFFAVVPKIASVINSPYSEILFRIIPFLSVAVIVWIFQSKLISSWIMKIVWGISCALIPIVLYYSSILYLELPAAVLMLVVCFRIKGLLQKDFNDIRHDPGWYALILIGFIKETAITFLFCFVVCRILAYSVKAIQNYRSQSSAKNAMETKVQIPFTKSLIEEILIVSSSLGPLLLYLIFRSYLTSTRTFTPNLANLLNLSSYQAIGQSLVQQFGPYLLFFICGWILLLVRKEFTIAGFFMLLVLFIPLFHAVDNISFAGYSRFNLFVLPPILAGSSFLFNWMIERKKYIAAVTVAGIILLNLVISPVNSDGTKIPYWGNYLADTSEHYYPYQEALSWIKDTYPQNNLLSAGAFYPYYFDFYFNKLDWFPTFHTLSAQKGQADKQALSIAVDSAEKNHYQVILFQVVGKAIPVYPTGTPFNKVKIFQNDAQTLLVLYK